MYNKRKIIHMKSLLSKYKSVFDGLGCLPGECHITVNKDVRSKIDPPRKIPFSLHDRLKKELDHMESLDVITKVTEPTSWVSSLLLVEKKNGQLRVCLDPRNLNEAICRSHYPIPTIDIVRSKLHGASYFSTLDASSGFWVICLDTESSMLCTFNTPFGRYRFKRLPFGINCAPEIFHRIMTETFGVLPGVMVYADDILVYGKDSQEHDENLQRVFKKAQEVNLKFNKKERLQWLVQATENDECLQLLKKYYKEGWPDRKSEVNKLVLPYWNCRHEVHAVGNLLLKGNSLIIPTKLRSEILKIIHSGHQGIEKSKNFARGVVYWPLMSHDIQQCVEHCETCLSHRNANPPEPLMSHKICTFPWEKVGVDYLKFKNQTILVIEDYYSNYIEIANVSSTGAKALINALKSIFSRHGIPVFLNSDNGPPYNSQEFKQFLASWSITHTTSSPYLPRSNGLVESGVKIVKRILTKCAESGDDPYLALLQYRTTPRNNLPSPSELLMSRRLRTLIPTVIKHLEPKVMSHRIYKKIKQQNNYKQKFYYDKKSKILPNVKKGDKIMFKKSPESKWQPGEIVKECEQPRSFIVEAPDGSTYRRNRQHISSHFPSPTKDISQEKKGESPVSSKNVSPKMEMRMEESKESKDEGIKRTISGRQVKAPVRFQDCM
ncbi:uncharacterized protein K02A2.6-like isoform X2 [Maniola jurtina]|uniref:uncharacterized protein K02A2.6-like isoform X2 n=1 Tax=Maniola jurtina TaxID=191418 RepID=UPI001E68CE9A|nr:uncharacterized protein K02A2.6-like isoform X2 [Maniola jurtina]